MLAHTTNMRQFLQRFITIDFHKFLICITQDKGTQGKGVTEIPFAQIVEIQKDDVSAFQNEHGVDWKFKFRLITTTRAYEFFSRNKHERSVWM